MLDQAIADIRNQLGSALAARAEIDEKIVDLRAMLVVTTNLKRAEDAEKAKSQDDPAI